MYMNSVDVLDEKERICNNPVALTEAAHEMWMAQAFWMHQFIETIDDSEAGEVVQKELLDNVQNIADLYGDCFDEKTLPMDQLIRTYFTIGMAYALAALRGDTVTVDQLLSRWYQIAEEIAGQLSKKNPYYSHETLLKMWHQYVSSAQHQILLRVSEDYLTKPDLIPKNPGPEFLFN